MNKPRRVIVKWNKKEQDWWSKYDNLSEKDIGRIFFDMIRKYEDFMMSDWQGKPTGFDSLRKYLDELGYDPDTLTISVKAKTT